MMIHSLSGCSRSLKRCAESNIFDLLTVLPLQVMNINCHSCISYVGIADFVDGNQQGFSVGNAVLLSLVYL
jgi:hypothetical protein